MEGIIISAVVGTVAAVLSVFTAAKLGLDTQRTTLVQMLKDQIAALKEENALLKAENLQLRIRVRRLELEADEAFRESQES